MAEGYLIWCPFPDEEEARRAADTLLDEGLIACANLVPGLVSMYVWQGERGEAREVGLLSKTHPSLAAEAIAKIGTPSWPARSRSMVARPEEASCRMSTT